jgi:hypothetical protein
LILVPLHCHPTTPTTRGPFWPFIIHPHSMIMIWNCLNVGTTIFMKFLVNGLCNPNCPFVIPNVDIHLIQPYHLQPFLCHPFVIFFHPF